MRCAHGERPTDVRRHQRTGRERTPEDAAARPCDGCKTVTGLHHPRSSICTARGQAREQTRSLRADAVDGRAGAFAVLAGTYQARCQSSSLNATPRVTARSPVQTDGMSSPSPNPTFLLERLGSECTDVQGLRELTVNGLDAIAALDDRTGGRVVWDLDWQRFDASTGRVRKLSVTDTGTGMSADQLRYYINQLAASGREQSRTGNFGVGAKVAAGFATLTDSNTDPGIRVRARWCASSATLMGVGASSRSGGRTATPTSGCRSAKPTSPGPYAARLMEPRSCSSASTSATTQRSRRQASPMPTSSGSPATSTAASYSCPSRSKCSPATTTIAASPDSFERFTARAITSSSAPGMRARSN